jgi:hypothetical protein
MMNSLKLGVPSAMALVLTALLAGGLRGQGGVDLPKPCGAECFKTALEAGKACSEGGGGFLQCAQVFGEALSACRKAAGCEGAERPPVCGEECLAAARSAVKACAEAGGDVRACIDVARTQLRTCLETAGCDIPKPPGAPFCGIGCLKDSLSAARDCIKNGGKLGECVGVFRAAFEACRKTEDCAAGEDATPVDDKAVLPLLLEDPFIRGDYNRDQTVDISDPIGVLGYLFTGLRPPVCMDSADANDDGGIDVTDAILILQSLFEGTASLAQPYPQNGFDPTVDEFICSAPESSGL